jgi:hypothetical protein
MPVVMMSGHATIETAVEATRIGALDFLEKPIALQRLLATVKRALRNPETAATPELSIAALGRSNSLADAKKRLGQLAGSGAPLLLRGERGMRADLFARLLAAPGAPFLAGSEMLSQPPRSCWEGGGRHPVHRRSLTPRSCRAAQPGVSAAARREAPRTAGLVLAARRARPRREMRFRPGARRRGSASSR